MKNEIINLHNNQDYKKWYQNIKAKIKSSQIKAVTKVNTELLALYWEIGKEIVNKQKESNYGDLLIEQLSKDLSIEFASAKGFSRSNLFYIKSGIYFIIKELKKSHKLWDFLRKIIKMN